MCWLNERHDTEYLPAEELLKIPVGVVFQRDPRVMPGRPGDYMIRTTNGWSIGPLRAFADFPKAVDMTVGQYCRRISGAEA